MNLDTTLINEVASNHAIGTNVHEQYYDVNRNTFYRGLGVSYSYIYDVCEKLNRKSVLDFGAGIGTSRFVYDTKHRTFDHSMCDMIDHSWRDDENVFFDNVRTELGYECINAGNLTGNDFILVTDLKFDCVIFFRFPPLTDGAIDASHIRKKMQPYITDDCIFLYANSHLYYERNYPFFTQPGVTIEYEETPLVIASF